MTTSRYPAITLRAITVAHADPRTPIAGAPRFPKIRIQLKTTFTMLARTSATMIGRTTPMPCRYRLKVAYISSGITLHVNADR
jgi:hypothetical protein